MEEVVEDEGGEKKEGAASRRRVMRWNFKTPLPPPAPASSGPDKKREEQEGGSHIHLRPSVLHTLASHSSSWVLGDIPLHHSLPSSHLSVSRFKQ